MQLDVLLLQGVIPAQAGIQFFSVIFSDPGFPIRPDALRDQDMSGMTIRRSAICPQ